MNRLTPATVTMLMFLVVGGLIVAYIGKSLMARTELKVTAATRNIPMPTADIPAGTEIRDEHLGLGPVLETDLQRDVLMSTRAIIGRVAKTKLTAAAPIRSNMLYEPGANAPLKLAEGMVALAVQIAGSQSLVSGLIKPGDHVDVLFTPESSSDSTRLKGGLTMTLFKGVKMLAINGKQYQWRIDTDKNNVTLELTPEQANVIVLAEKKGSLTMTSNPHGKGTSEVTLRDKDRAFLDEILGLEPEKKPEPKEEKPPYVTQHYKGAIGAEIQFRDGQRVLNDSWNSRPTLPRDDNNPPDSNPQTVPPNPTNPGVRRDQNRAVRPVVMVPVQIN